MARGRRGTETGRAGKPRVSAAPVSLSHTVAPSIEGQHQKNAPGELCCDRHVDTAQIQQRADKIASADAAVSRTVVPPVMRRGRPPGSRDTKPRLKPGTKQKRIPGQPSRVGRPLGSRDKVPRRQKNCPDARQLTATAQPHPSRDMIGQPTMTCEPVPAQVPTTPPPPLPPPPLPFNTEIICAVPKATQPAPDVAMQPDEAVDLRLETRVIPIGVAELAATNQLVRFPARVFSCA
jgi:hypothetical protein